MSVEQSIPATIVTLERKDRYEFIVRVVDGAEFIADEEPPLGSGHGPSPVGLLGSATGSCLATSLLFCLEKAHISVGKVSARIEIGKIRNERGSLRIGSMKVALSARVPQEQHEKVKRCLALFQEYCVVTESIRRGIPVEVDVTVDS